MTCIVIDAPTRASEANPVEFQKRRPQQEPALFVWFAPLIKALFSKFPLQ